jgi:hypothetical protein
MMELRLGSLRPGMRVPTALWASFRRIRAEVFQSKGIRVQDAPPIRRMPESMTKLKRNLQRY